MEVNSIISPLIFIIVSLIAGGVLKHFLKKTPMPYTVGLFSFGLIIGLLTRFHLLEIIPTLSHSIEKVSNANPDIILYLFLPILIFDAAYELDVHLFKKSLINTSLLAIPGMIIAMLLTASLILYLSSFYDSYSNWNWNYAFMFGALISATDPVAVVALLKELNVSKRFSTLVDGESMLNDGTGIVLFMIFFGIYTTAGAVTSPITDFLIVVFGGAFLGFFVAFLCLSFITKVKGDKMIQNSIIIVSAYLIFLLAQSYLNVSGVIALVCYGVAISYYGKLKLSAEVNSFMEEFWELAAHLGNTLIFIIVGIMIALKTDFTWSSFIILGMLYIGVNLIRGTMISLLYPIMKRFGYGLTRRESFILTWGGLRGALALTLALIVTYTTEIPLNIREEILFQTAGIVTLTLTINATTIKWLLNKLGLNKESNINIILKAGVKKQIIEESNKYLAELKGMKALEKADWKQVANVILENDRTDLPKINCSDLETDLRKRIVRKQKFYCWELYNKKIITENTLKKWTAVADDIYDSNGEIKLSVQGLIFHKLRKPTKIFWIEAPIWYRKLLDKINPGKTIRRYDLTRGFILIESTAFKLIKDYEASKVFNDKEKKIIDEIKKEIKVNLVEAEKFMLRLAARHPVTFAKAVTQKATRMLLYKEKQILKRLAHEGMISEKDAKSLFKEINDKNVS